MPRTWYYYVGAPGSELTLANYQLASATGPFVQCPPGPQLCAIYAFNGGENPSVISSNLARYIARAKSLQTPQPDTPTGAIKYAYSKAS